MMLLPVMLRGLPLGDWLNSLVRSVRRWLA